MTAPSNTIKLSHARDHLRQHFAIDAGLESMDHRPLGSALKDVDPELREECRKQMEQCRDNAHWEISGMIHGTKIAVWKERPDGGLEPAGAEWAKGIFDSEGIMPAALYFDRAEWEALLVSMTTAESRAYFAEPSSPRKPTVRSLPVGKHGQMIAREAGRMKVEYDDGDSDALILRKAVREVLLKLTEATTEADPAPWVQVDPTLVEMFAEGDEQGYIRRKKIEHRAISSLKIALLSGKLTAQFRDGSEACDVPGWAWQGVELHASYWFESRLPIDPFMPDEWYRWSGHDIYVDRNALNGWLASADLYAFGELPELPAPFDETSRPIPITKRLPRDATFVSISEAVSWIGLGVSMDQGRLSLALEGMGIDRANSQRAVNEAMAKLADLGTGGKLAMRGKFISSYLTDETLVQTESIDPVRLADFARFDVLHDGLDFGQGLTWFNGESVFEKAFTARDDAFRCVTVSRADLMTHFPDTDSVLIAMLTPLPASLPDIGPVLGLEEALTRRAYGTASFDIDVWQNVRGELTFTDPSGDVIAPLRDGESPQHHAPFIAANCELHGALRDGTLASYVAPAGAQPLAIPRLYWNGVNPELLDLTYRGIRRSVLGKGCPVLLSRQAFDAWCVAARASTKQSGDVPPNRQLDHDEIIGMAIKMRDAQPDISKGSAGASIVADLPRNPKTGKRRDTRHIERIIAHLWEGGI